MDLRSRRSSNSVPRCRPPDERVSFDAAIVALHVAAGVSYYKAFVPHKVDFGRHALTPAQLAFFQRLYRSGLGEFGFRNNLDIADRVDFLKHADADAPRGVPGSGDGSATDSLPLEPAGAFKPATSFGRASGWRQDSLVSVEILRAAREPMVLFAVNPKQPIHDCARASGLPFLSVTRQLDSALFDLNSAGAYNGHVPITAIVSLIAVAAAFVRGYDTIVLSNERSADEGNLIHDGVEVNHQYSKTSRFEFDFRRYVADHISGHLSYFSLLRPLSELHISQLMARSARYDNSFTSCNRAFRLHPTGPTVRWCRECPKCRFTFLMLATAMKQERLLNIFGANLLDDPGQLAGYQELVGLVGNKPWECVGEIARSASAVVHLASDPTWAGCFVVFVSQMNGRCPESRRRIGVTCSHRATSITCRRSSRKP